MKSGRQGSPLTWDGCHAPPAPLSIYCTVLVVSVSSQARQGALRVSSSHQADTLFLDLRGPSSEHVRVKNTLIQDARGMGWACFDELSLTPANLTVRPRKANPFSHPSFLGHYCVVSLGMDRQKNEPLSIWSTSIFFVTGPFSWAKLRVHLQEKGLIFLSVMGLSRRLQRG